jgi:small subunit ribosomal protein S21
MRRKKNFRKRRPKDDSVGLSVKVFNNNIEGALKAFKKKVKNSGILQELRKKQYYEKPSRIRREKKNLAKLRNKYKMEKTEKSY